MDLELKQTTLTPVRNIEIPEVFNRRMKTGIDRIDNLFEEGILPGSALTLTAPAGCGKTTLMLQVLEALSLKGHAVGYFSGEESIYQLAYTANRVNATNVPVANETDIDTIKSHMKHLDLVIIDSFQALTSKTKMNTKQLEKHAVQSLTRAAKDNECTIVFIMHLTKSGDLKGGTIVPHTVDANLKITKLADTDDDADRVIFFEKNRFGPLNELECKITHKGYDFDAEISKLKQETDNKTNKISTKQQDHDKILQELENGPVITRRVVELLDDNATRAYSRLRDLTLSGKILKHGRGANAMYLLNNETQHRIAAESN